MRQSWVLGPKGSLDNEAIGSCNRGSCWRGSLHMLGEMSFQAGSGFQNVFESFTHDPVRKSIKRLLC